MERTFLNIQNENVETDFFFFDKIKHKVLE